MSLATWSSRDDERQQADQQAQPQAGPTNVEKFIAARVRELIDNGWTWGRIAAATGLTPEQAQWYANNA